MKKSLLVVFIFLFVVVGFVSFYAGLVGHHLIRRKDVQYRNEVAKIYNPEDKRDVGYFVLVRSYTNLQILENNGYEVTEEKVEREEKRIENTSQDKEKLNKIKAVFEGDVEAYRRVFVLPAFVDRTIYHDFFLNNEALHRDSQKMVESFLEELKRNPQLDFEKETRKRDGQFDKVAVSEEQGFFSERHDSFIEGLKKMTSKKGKSKISKKTASGAVMHPEFKAWEETALKNIQPGQWVDQPVSRGPAWLLLRVRDINREKPVTYHFDAAVFPKQNYDLWRAREEKSIFVFPRPVIP